MIIFFATITVAMADTYNLKKFVNVGSRIGDYYIGFTRSGFFLSSEFCTRESMKNYRNVILYFDEENKAVGLQFSNDDNAEGRFKMIHPISQGTAMISPRSFIKSNKLEDPKYFGRKVPKKITQEGIGEIFVIDLLETNTQAENSNTAEKLPEAVG